MIKVLDKTFGILETIVRATPHPMGPMALAEALELNRATCSRILKMLLESGYIVQVSRQAGYVAGPRILTLSNMAMFQSALLKKAVPVIDRTAEAVRDSVLISQIYAGERYVLYLRNCNPDRTIRLAAPSFHDIYATATGVMEMAYRSSAEQLTHYDAVRERKNILPEFRERENLHALLERVRGNGMYHTRKGDQGIFAFPVFSNRRFLASLGCSMPVAKYTAEHIEEIKRIVGGAASEISASLSTIDSIG